MDISESGATKIFESFVDNSIYDYKIGRDFPAINKNSRLSPYIRFGLISVHRIWHLLDQLNFDKNVEHYKSEIVGGNFLTIFYIISHLWKIKIFKLNLIDLIGITILKNLMLGKKETGFPIVDAGMKELWQTGYMHNRIRMVVASFLVKNLLIDWRMGEAWFWDCLFDVDYHPI